MEMQAVAHPSFAEPALRSCGAKASAWSRSKSENSQWTRLDSPYVDVETVPGFVGLPTVSKIGFWRPSLNVCQCKTTLAKTLRSLKDFITGDRERRSESLLGHLCVV